MCRSRTGDERGLLLKLIRDPRALGRAADLSYVFLIAAALEWRTLKRVCCAGKPL